MSAVVLERAADTLAVPSSLMTTSEELRAWARAEAATAPALSSHQALRLRALFVEEGRFK